MLLSGILPTLQKSDLTLDNLAPIPRYRQLNDGVIALRGGPFSIHIKGLDHLGNSLGALVTQSRLIGSSGCQAPQWETRGTPTMSQSELIGLTSIQSQTHVR